MSTPLCKCGKEVDPRRVRAVGEVRCMKCPGPPANVFMVEVSKSNMTITSNPRYLIGGLASDGMTGRSDPGGNGNYMQLGSKK